MRRLYAAALSALLRLEDGSVIPQFKVVVYTEQDDIDAELTALSLCSEDYRNELGYYSHKVSVVEVPQSILEELHA